MEEQDAQEEEEEHQIVVTCTVLAAVSATSGQNVTKPTHPSNH
jgi:hypothetical protein